MSPGTAGSCTLLAQIALPCLLFTSGSTFSGRGGTDVNWSPPIDEMRLCLMPLLQRFGVQVPCTARRWRTVPATQGRALSPGGRAGGSGRTVVGSIPTAVAFAASGTPRPPLPHPCPRQEAEGQEGNQEYS